MIAYALVPLLASGVLVVRYLSMSEPSVVSKFVVVAVLGASLVVWWRYPALLAIAVLLQVGVSLFVLIYVRVNPYAS